MAEEMGKTEYTERPWGKSNAGTGLPSEGIAKRMTPTGHPDLHARVDADIDPERAMALFDMLAESIRAEKPMDRSGLDRHYAVTLTDLGKVKAYYYAYCVQQVEE